MDIAVYSLPKKKNCPRFTSEAGKNHFSNNVNIINKYLPFEFGIVASATATAALVVYPAHLFAEGIDFSLGDVAA